jgi:hypothetical protein
LGANLIGLAPLERFPPILYPKILEEANKTFYVPLRFSILISPALEGFTPNLNLGNLKNPIFFFSIKNNISI